MTVRLWVIKAIAMASEGCEYPAGERHALLAFAAAPNHDGALDQMQRGIAAHGWGVAEVTKSGEISSNPDAIQDDILRKAARNAVECGCGIVAYADPIPTGSEQNSN